MHYFVAKLFSIAIITYTNIRHLRPMTGRFITRTANMQDACDSSTLADARPHCRLWHLSRYPSEYPHELYFARN